MVDSELLNMFATAIRAVDRTPTQMDIEVYDVRKFTSLRDYSGWEIIVRFPPGGARHELITRIRGLILELYAPCPKNILRPEMLIVREKE